MRLIHIKLAGFKSFVDATHIAVPGQLVGVVGPNGCGKSNIIDAVRWVLGESRAAALRGESMQDVIFNGSTQRKPVARAMVELVFDNSLGRAAGQWSQYAEVSVRRLLQRDGESSYFINNTPVRRRDIQDIFLGTGVGPRAYAIIEQGMISRVIEAKPEDLRVFLEEAAGISKYKERRRETENRLADTRENLARVDDIRHELEAQITKLSNQAEVAKEYKTLQSNMQQKQQLLWLIRKRDALAELAMQLRDIEIASNALEAETARSREVEKRLEYNRQAHYAAGDAANAAQGGLYAVNSEVQRLEAERRLMLETRQRLHAQAVQLVSQLVQWGRQSGELREALDMWNGRRVQLEARLAHADERSMHARSQLPQLEASLRDLMQRSSELRERIVETQRALQVEEAHRANRDKSMTQLDERANRLAAEMDGLIDPDALDIAGAEGQLAGFDEQLASLGNDIQQLLGTLPELEAARDQANHRFLGTERRNSQLQGRLATLKQIQARVDANEPIDAWLDRHGFGMLPRLWSKIAVAPGWETAVESVLRERMHAVALTDGEALSQLIEQPPPAKLTLFEAPRELSPAAGLDAFNEAARGAETLVNKVSFNDASTRALIEDWLQGYIAIDVPPSRAERTELAPGSVLVDRTGHQFRRYSVSFFAPDGSDAGILARQREIEGLARELAELTVDLTREQARFSHTDQALASARERAQELRQRENDCKQERHAVELALLKLVQSATRTRERRAQITRELADIASEQDSERRRQADSMSVIAACELTLAELHDAFKVALSEQQAAEGALAAQRELAQQAARDAQEAAFAVREAAAKAAEVDRVLSGVLEQSAHGTTLERGLREELAGLDDAELRAQLDEQLALCVVREAALADARNHHDHLSNELRRTEGERLAIEQGLGPLREKIAELRLREQAARLAGEQYSQQLGDSQADEAALMRDIERAPRPGTLQNEINKLNQAIAALGAINMAALDELSIASERRDFLGRQSTDLSEALATLENAIRRIDRETRDMLQQTFDTVNKNFSEMFPSLFGGGEAKLVMTGDEILDAGVLVLAQPPGKRNTSIHLLSGGEKALTAIALVFSLFQLNPAPFCLLDEVDAPLDDANTERFCALVSKMSSQTQFLFVSHNKITMEMAKQLVGVTMQEQGVSRIVAVDVEQALKLREAA